MTRQAWVTVVALVSVVKSNGLTTTDLFPPVAGDVKLQRPSWSNWTYCYDFLFGGHRMDEFRVGLNGFIIFRNLDTSTYADIKAFYAHVDTTTFDVWYRETTDQQTLSLLDDQIRGASTLYENFNAANALIFTWNETGFSHLHNSSGSDSVVRESRNTFQVVVVSDEVGTESFVILSYLKLEWAIRLSSSDDDKFALARFDLPNSKFYHLPESQTEDVLNLANISNTDTPGRWVYRISGETIQSGVRNFPGSDVSGCTELLSCESIDVDMPGVCYCPTKRIDHGSSCTQDVCLAGLSCGASTHMCECLDTVTTYFNDTTKSCLRKGGCGADCKNNYTCLSQSLLQCENSKCTNKKCDQLQAVGKSLFADTENRTSLISALQLYIDNTIDSTAQMFYETTLYEWKVNMAELDLRRLQTELNQIAAVVAINTDINNAITDDNITELMKQANITNIIDRLRERYITKLKALKKNKTDTNVLLTRAEIIAAVQSVNTEDPTRPTPTTTSHDSNMDQKPPKEDTNTGSVSSDLSNREWFVIGVAILAVLAIVGGAMYHCKYCKGCACCTKKQQAAPPQAPPAATTAGSDKGIDDDNQSPGSAGAGVEKQDVAGANRTNQRKSADGAGRPTNSSNKRQSFASAGSNRKNHRPSVDSAGTNRTSTTVSSYLSEQSGSSQSSVGTYSSSAESGSSSSGSTSTKS